MTPLEEQARKRVAAEQSAAGVGPRPSANGRHTPDDGPSLSYEPVPWPDPPAEEAYYGLAGEIVRAIEPETEADPVALLMQLLTYFGSAVGRTAYRPVGARRHHGNLYCVLVGRTAKGRKGTALAWVESLFSQVDPTWLDDCAQTGLSSGEGLIAAVRDEVRKMVDGEEVVVQGGAKDKRLLVVEEEFGGTLQLARREGNILSSILRQGWDGGRLRTMTKTNPLRATDAHISIVGHVTRDDLLKHLGSTEAANGFANRFLWLCVKRSKVLPDGGSGDAGLSRFHADLETALERARLRKCLSRDPEAVAIWHEVYPTLSAETPGLLGAITNRAEAQVLRLSILYALLDCSEVIQAAHLMAALALWDYCRRSCAWVFGSSLGDGDADAIAEALEAAGDAGLSGREISALFSRHRSHDQLRRALGMLVENGLARVQKSQTGGRPSERWFANKANKAKEVPP